MKKSKMVTFLAYKYRLCEPRECCATNHSIWRIYGGIPVGGNDDTVTADVRKLRKQ